MDILNNPVKKNVKNINISHFKMEMQIRHNVSVKMNTHLLLDMDQLNVDYMEVFGVIISIKIRNTKLQFNQLNQLNQLIQLYKYHLQDMLE